MGRKLLVIDDDEAGCRLVAAIFAADGFEVLTAHDGAEGLAAVARHLPEAVILDLHLPRIDGLEVLDRLRGSHPALPVIVLTGDTEVRTAVRATQLGAVDYLMKPIDHDEIRVVVGRALEHRALRTEVEELRLQAGQGAGLARQMGPGPAVRQIIDQVSTVAASNFSVLLLGETGTGKELVAQAIHRQSARRAMPFVALDCGAIPETLLESELFGHERGAFTGAERPREGRFSLADGGTLFLDEVGNLPMALQAKLLRVLESREIQALGASRARTLDVRFVAATNDDLQERAGKGQFRPDLYFRLAQYTIRLPALRDRAGDIPHLAQRFLEEASVELRHPVHVIPPEVLGQLAAHPWPGNVRELRNVIRQAVLESKDLVLHPALIERLLGKAVSVTPGGQAQAGGRSLREIADDAAGEAQRLAICDALRTSRGNKSEAARSLRTDFKTLHLKMKDLGIRAGDFSP
jgi:two-component system response regulator HydG